MVFGKTHAKFLRALMRELNKLQAAEWMGDLLTDDEASCCYMADGAESMQSEWLAQILSKRDKDGKLAVFAIDMAVMDSKTAEAQAVRFTEALADIADAAEAAGEINAATAARLRSFKPTCAMNDRAANARAAARRVLGLPDGDDDPTCSEHGLVNILEKAREAIDAIVRRMMNISDEQAAADSEKVKALRTVVGWFSSPACSLIFMMQKYVALHSSKGYAVGAKAAVWLEAELAAAQDQADAEYQELFGYIEDMQAIRGSRNYVFFINAAVTERLLQRGSIFTYLEEEADLAESSAGGKLRNAILTGGRSEGAMAALRAMAIICDAVMWPALTALKPGPEKHVLDVLPDVWPKIHTYFTEAAEDPASVVEGSLSLRSRLSQAAPTEAPSQATRGGRARLDMLRICGAAAGDPLVAEMVGAAMKAMVPATENHAAEWLDGGKLCTANLTPELYKRYDALIASSSAVERIHAVGKSNDERAGSQRDDTRSGIVLARYNDQAAWLNGKQLKELERLMATSRRLARKFLKCTMREKRREQGLAKREARQQRLSTKRAKREARAAEQRRIEALEPATTFSEIVNFNMTQLTDQLKYHKQVHKATGFTVTGKGRTAAILQLQSLILQQNPAANDLKDGDDGTQGRAARQPRAAGGKGGSSSSGGRAAKRQRTAVLSNDCGDEWEEDEEFPAIILDSKVSEGMAVDGHRKGVKLCKCRTL